MTRCHWPGICGVFGLLTVGVVLAQPTPVQVELNPSEITVGDPIGVKLTLVWDGEEPTALPRFPDWKDQGWGTAEVLTVEAVRVASSRGGRHVYTQVLTLTAFATGEVELPPAVVTVPLAAEEARVPVREGVRFMVKSVLPSVSDEATDQLEDLEPRPGASLRAWPGDRRFAWTAITLGAFCLLAGFNLQRQLRHLTIAPRVGGETVALSAIDELVASLRSIDVHGACEPAHTALSQALRRFLGRGLEFHALESTTREIRRRLEDEQTFESDDLAQIGVQLLEDCDQVKYAHREVSATQIEQRLESSARWAHEVDQVLHPPVSEEGELENRR